MIPSNSVLFMNSSCKRSVMKKVNKEFEKSRYFHLPVNIRPISKSIERRPCKFKIISIGRIVDFKTYNYHIIDVVRKLKNDRIEVLYEIYGEGPQKEQLIEKIAEYKLESNVFVKGKLKYEEMPMVLEDAYLFVGMGTTVIEASMCGVPSIVAIVLNPKPTCYGFLYNQKNDNLGEIDDGMLEVSFENIIKESIAWTNDQYKEASEKSIEYSKKYFIDDVMNEFILCLNDGEKDKLNYLPFWSYEKFFFRYIVLRLIKKAMIFIKKYARRKYGSFA
jgi:glycosyltransferase involved in cell wall biosynthesis